MSPRCRLEILIYIRIMLMLRKKLEGIVISLQTGGGCFNFGVAMGMKYERFLQPWDCSIGQLNTKIVFGNCL